MDQRLVRGLETRRRILDRAVELASVEGLGGLSLGRLAADLEMSKAGVFAHFGSKEELQLATIDTASAVFSEHVTSGLSDLAPGLPQLMAVSSAWLDYIEGDCCRGGCFFSTTASEMDNRPGPVRERLVDVAKTWLALLCSVVRDAIRDGHLHESTDPEQLALELQAFVLGANWSRQLLRDKSAVNRMRAAVQARLHAVATPRGNRILGATRTLTSP